MLHRHAKRQKEKKDAKKEEKKLIGISNPRAQKKYIYTSHPWKKKIKTKNQLPSCLHFVFLEGFLSRLKTRDRMQRDIRRPHLKSICEKHDLGGRNLTSFAMPTWPLRIRRRVGRGEVEREAGMRNSRDRNRICDNNKMIYNGKGWSDWKCEYGDRKEENEKREKSTYFNLHMQVCIHTHRYK